MANDTLGFKNLLPSRDITTSKTLLHEAIDITGSIISGTYADNNIKNFSVGMHQSVYDYPYLSSSANHIFDLTCGYAAASSLSGASSTQNAKKINMYNQLASVLVGYRNNTLQRFDQDGDFGTTTDKINESYFISFARLLTKDEVKKGSFTLELGVNASYASPFGQRVTLKDVEANPTTNIFKTNSPAGEYGLLYISNSAGAPLNGYTGSAQQAAGLVFYQAGVAVLTASVFNGLLSSSISTAFSMSSTGESAPTMLSGTAISGNCDAVRHRLYNISFNNTTELNSTVYYCRAHHNEFNYSSNPTYLSESKIRVKNTSEDEPITYITTVGLYTPTNELAGVAKLSTPVKKTTATEAYFRVRFDY